MVVIGNHHFFSEEYFVLYRKRCNFATFYLNRRTS